jgi:hypothetical protein
MVLFTQLVMKNHSWYSTQKVLKILLKIRLYSVDSKLEDQVKVINKLLDIIRKMTVDIFAFLEQIMIRF